MADQNYDIVIVGGSLGGVAAALRAGAMGASVCLIEATGWLGGQYTAQGVSKPDENRFIETVGSTASYRGFRHEVRLHYRNNYHLSALGASQPLFNPGGPYPGFALDPRTGHTVISQKLAELPTVHVPLFTRMTLVEVQVDSIQSVTAEDQHGNSTRYVAKMFLDATDLGEMLPIANVEYRVGAESAAEFGEEGAPDEARPDWIQPITHQRSRERVFRAVPGTGRDLARPVVGPLMSSAGLDVVALRVKPVLLLQIPRASHRVASPTIPSTVNTGCV